MKSIKTCAALIASAAVIGTAFDASAVPTFIGEGNISGKAGMAEEAAFANSLISAYYDTHPSPGFADDSVGDVLTDQAKGGKSLVFNLPDSGGGSFVLLRWKKSPQAYQLYYVTQAESFDAPVFYNAKGKAKTKGLQYYTVWRAGERVDTGIAAIGGKGLATAVPDGGSTGLLLLGGLSAAEAIRRRRKKS